MKYQLDKRENLSIFKLEERRLDSNNAAKLKSEFIVLTQADVIENLLVDMSQVEFSDSTGLSALLIAHRAISAKDGLFGLVGAQPAVEKLIGISHLDRVILMYDNLEDAIVDFEIMLEDKEAAEEDPFFDEDLENYQDENSGVKSKKKKAADDDDDFGDFGEETEDEFGDEFGEFGDDSDDDFPKKKR